MFLRSAILSLAALAAAKEMPKDEFKAAQLFDSGVRHENNKALKLVGNGSPEHVLGTDRRYRKHGLRKKLPESTLQLSTPNLLPLPTAPTAPQRRQRTPSSARTSISTTFCPTLLWEVLTVLDPHRGVGHLALAVSLLPSANLMAQHSPRSRRKASCLTWDAFLSTPLAANGVRSVARTIT